MIRFLRAHGADPSPAQRPLLAGALGGMIALFPAGATFGAFGSFAVAADAVMRLPRPIAAAVIAGLFIVAGVLYGAVFRRAANDPAAGWLLGLSYGFLLWVAAPIVVLPLVSGQTMAAGLAAAGFLASFLLWGLALGILVPLVHRPLGGRLDGRRQLAP